MVLGVHCFECEANDAAGLGWRALMIVFGSFYRAHFLVVAGRCARAKDRSFRGDLVRSVRRHPPYKTRNRCLKVGYSTSTPKLYCTSTLERPLSLDVVKRWATRRVPRDLSLPKCSVFSERPCAYRQARFQILTLVRIDGVVGAGNVRDHEWPGSENPVQWHRRLGAHSRKP